MTERTPLAGGVGAAVGAAVASTTDLEPFAVALLVAAVVGAAVAVGTLRALAFAD